MPLTLYKLDPSPPARAVMMVIEALGLKVRYVDVNVLKGEQLEEEYVKMNPQHTVPTLKDAEFVISDSHAIATYLVTSYGEDNLYPRDVKKRALIDRILYFDCGVLFPTLVKTIGPVLFGSDTSFQAENLRNFEPVYQQCENFLNNHWFVGDSLSIADICCVATVSSLNCIIPIDCYKYPKLVAWLERCSKLDFYIKANEPGLKIFADLIKDKTS